jgi:Plasmid pRiA4b ORF-3-like protein
MATKRIDAAQNIYQIKVTLLGTKPPIWRRVLVPPSLTLRQLHDVLQIAMGWQNCHMHEFRVGRRFFGEPSPEEGLMGVTPTEDERKVCLPAVLGKVGAKMIYTYDMGDSWEHSILLEKQLPIDPSVKYPTCLDGQLACPPEDCGGIPGYYNLLEALADPRHPEHEELSEWIGGHFNPQAFSVERANRLLSPARRRSKNPAR